MNTTRWSGFLKRPRASQPSNSRSVRRPADAGGFGNTHVNAARPIQTTAVTQPALVELSAPRALTTQQPTIHPTVATARIGPNWRWEFCRREKTIVLAMLPVGE